MKKAAITMLVLGAAGFLSACEKSSTVDGRAGAELTLDKPADVTVRRAEMAKVDIDLKRKGFAGDVAIRFGDLPVGIEVVDAGNRIVGDEGSYTLRATDGAALVENHVASVTASAPNGIAVTQQFKITIKEKETADNR